MNYVKMIGQWDEDLATNLNAGLEHRVLAWARLRLERTGHAHFDKGELLRVLEVVNPRTGELSPVNARTLDRTVNALVDQGLLLPASGRRCLRPVGCEQGARNAPVTECKQPRATANEVTG
ncbi:hypothetical protein [Isoptericola sediminis]|uniref:Uncharacterized protein n=1 Tax=Isoptericola sediminis TaxID=2733572 RepID=A0A849K227_9MICO|nr:hypothetical protein [Isoptericola sediminis]NNU26791.1 hypothetical protein [Isoptericola sediminis]